MMTSHIAVAIDDANTSTLYIQYGNTSALGGEGKPVPDEKIVRRLIQTMNGLLYYPVVD
jgi:hypothetical protein